MSKDITDILLIVGHNVINPLLKSQIAHGLEGRKDSYEVSFTVKESTLHIKILFPYQFLNMRAVDPTLWIMNLGLYSGRLLSKYNTTDFTRARVIIEVNGDERIGEKDWIAACNVPDLIEAATKEKVIQGVKIDPEASILGIMDVSRN